MTNGSIATRYARALFEEARAQFVDKEVYEHLGMLYECIKSEPQFVITLQNPRVSSESKFRLLVTASGVNAGVWAHAGKAPKSESYVSTLYTRFLKLLLLHRREEHIRTMIFVYQDLYREYYKIDKVVFETAVAMDSEVIDRVTAIISARTHRKVECETKVNPGLIGGFRLQIDDTRYDYSYATRLESIRRRLTKK